MTKKVLLTVLISGLILLSACKGFKYHVYGFEFTNETDRDVSVSFLVKTGSPYTASLKPGADTIFYQERRMAKDFDNPVSMFREYFREVKIFFSGITPYVKFEEGYDPLNFNPEYDIFELTKAWEFAIRDMDNPAGRMGSGAIYLYPAHQT